MARNSRKSEKAARSRTPSQAKDGNTTKPPAKVNIRIVSVPWGPNDPRFINAFLDYVGARHMLEPRRDRYQGLMNKKR